jgi:hypothetical protein
MRPVAQDDQGWNRKQRTDADGQHRISGVDDPHEPFDAISAEALRIARCVTQRAGESICPFPTL